VNAKDGTVYVVKHGQLCEVNLKTTDPDIAENYDLALNVFQAAGKTQEQLWRMCAAVAAVVRG
jgi:hypothetical protein